MSRKWYEVLSPKYLHDTIGVYNGQWLHEMDRCWMSDDGFEVCSRIIMTDWGKFEHATLQRNGDEYFLANDGSGEISWALKQEIKNELFGKDRIAVEVFPQDSNLVDVMDIYHLWILPKGFKLPFGIHPKDVQCKPVNRGVNGNVKLLASNFVKVTNMDKKKGMPEGYFESVLNNASDDAMTNLLSRRTLL